MIIHKENKFAVIKWKRIELFGFEKPSFRKKINTNLMCILDYPIKRNCTHVEAVEYINW